MTKAKAYNSTYGKFIGGTAQKIADLTDRQWGAIVTTINDHGHDGDDFPMLKVVRTSETLDDFDDARSQNWSEKGSASRKSVDGLEVFVCEKFQTAKGRVRVDALFVFDLGEHRLAVMA